MMLKYGIWHVEHMEPIIMTKQGFRYINLMMKVRKNEITKIPRTVKKVVSFLRKQVSL